MFVPPQYPFEFPEGWSISTTDEVLSAFPPSGIDWNYETTIRMTNGTYGTVAANSISDNDVIRHTTDLNTLLEGTGQWTKALWITYPQSSGTLPNGWTLRTHPYGSSKGQLITAYVPNISDFGMQDLVLHKNPVIIQQLKATSSKEKQQQQQKETE